MSTKDRIWPTFMSSALRAGQHVGVALGVADVELEAGAPLALEAAAQDVDHASAGGAGGEGGERRRAPQPALGDRHSQTTSLAH